MKKIGLIKLLRIKVQNNVDNAIIAVCMINVLNLL